MMETRGFGDANLNSYDNNDQRRASQLADDTRRRLTRQFGPTAAAADSGQQQLIFREFTRDSLAASQRRKLSRAKRTSLGNVEATVKQKLEPDPYLASGVQLPQYILRRVPPELIGKPIEDIDPYYADKETFVIISRGKELIRFSANKALYLLGPFHPIRRIVLYILVSSVFNLFVILTILINCILMTIQGSEAVERTIEDTEIIFTVIYTFEFMLKVMARGFMLDEFAYLRDPWNILDVTVITLSYLTIVIQDLGNLSVMRTFRVLRALKTVAVIPGMKTIVGAVIDSVKNLKDVVVLTLFSLSVFSLLGLQIYMGSLTQKCILNGPSDMNDTHWIAWNSNNSNWLIDESNGGDQKSNKLVYKLCGNSTGAQSCPPGWTCLQGFGPNPDFGFTNFDTFGWSLICSFRLMTQDYWEGLYMQILKTAGSWHIIFFIVSIFLGSIYLMNLILAIVAMSYNELQRRAEEEEEANMEEEAAFLESCRLMELQDQNSDWDADRGSHLGLSYRPSLEIGLVGQTLLASFCQNGLLDERTRERLDQQMLHSASMMPAGGAGALRSRSLCLNHYQQDGLASPIGGCANQWMQYGSMNPCPNSQRYMMAASLNELSRRKNSMKTGSNFNYGGQLKTDVSPSGSLVGQRRLMRDISVSQLHNNDNFDGSSGLRRRNRFAFNHVSSGILPSGTNSSNYNPNQHHNIHQMPPQQKIEEPNRRTSIMSGNDFQSLREKAANIWIVSDDYSEKKPDDKILGQQRLNNADSIRFLSAKTINVGPRQDRSPSMQMGGRLVRWGRHRTGSSLSSAAKYDEAIGSAAPQSEMAICEQPSGFYPSGRMISTASNDHVHVSSGSYSPQRSLLMRRNSHARRHSIRRRRPSQRRPSSSSCRYSITSRRSTHCSNTDEVEPASATDRQNDVANNEKADSSSQLSPQRHQHNLSFLINAQAPTGSPLPLAQSDKKSCSLRTLRCSSNQLNVVDSPEKMRYLSVENFQRFGSLRPAQNRPSAPMEISHDLTNDESRQPMALVVVDEAETGATQQQTGPAMTAMRRDNLDGARFSIQPIAAPRCSFSRMRQSLLPSDFGSPTCEQQRRLRKIQQKPDHLSQAGSSQIRRLSRDFVRHADDWSRLSMSGNVDLRRLLRLWSNSNPYQTRRSIGSCSLQSQTSQTSQQQHQARLDSIAYQSPTNSRLAGQAYGNLRHQPPRRPSDMLASRPSCFATTSPVQQPRNWDDRSCAHSVTGSQSWSKTHEVLSAINGRQNRYQSDARAYGISLPLDENLINQGQDLDEISISARDKCLAYCLSCLDLLCIWECCDGWIRIQRLIALVVFDPFTELFILLCILINTLFMALDNDDVDEQMRRLFEQGNYFFTATFVVEAVMKIIALSPKFYFREGFNVFDAIIVGLSLLELGLEGVYGLSVLRTFRLLRVFRLARSWPTMNVLISICGHAISDLGNLTFVLAIIVFIFAVMGMQLFGNKYTASSFADGVVPRWNFNDFMHSFMIVFRILCAEWIEPLWDCMNAAPKEICIPFFISAVIIGNLVLLNLFLALLLASFGSSNLSGPQADHVDTRKLQEAIARFKRFGRFVKRMFSYLVWRLTDWILCCGRCRRQGSDDLVGGLAKGRGGKRVESHIATMSSQERKRNIEQRTEELKSMIRRSPEQHYHLNKLARGEQLDSWQQQQQQQPGARQLKQAQLIRIQLDGTSSQ